MAKQTILMADGMGWLIKRNKIKVAMASMSKNSIAFEIESIQHMAINANI